MNHRTLTSVVNVKDSPYEIYIGRAVPGRDTRTAKDSHFANSYRVEEYGREGAIEQYIQHFWCSPRLIAALPTLAGHVLGCWCHPKACHGHFLADLVNMRHMWREVVRHIDFAVALETLRLLERFTIVRHYRAWSEHRQDYIVIETELLRFPDEYSRLRVAWNEKVDNEWAEFRRNHDQWGEAELRDWQRVRL